MENNLLTHTKHETTHFDVLSDKRQTAKVAFLPFAGKTNVKLNLSIVGGGSGIIGLWIFMIPVMFYLNDSGFICTFHSIFMTHFFQF